jgi:DNA-binding MarR family transcriptional regulator
MAEPERPGEIMLLLQRALRDVEGRFLERLRAAGFEEARPSWLLVMRNLKPEGSRTTDIARRAGLTKQAIGLIVDDMEAHGVVERVADPDDRRAKLVRQPARQRPRNERVRAVLAELDREHEDAMGKREYRQLRELLRTFVGWGAPRHVDHK